MRLITEESAKTIREALQEYEETLKTIPDFGRKLRLQNKIRMMKLALTDMETHKIDKKQIKSKS